MLAPHHGGEQLTKYYVAVGQLTKTIIRYYEVPEYSQYICITGQVTYVDKCRL